MKLSAFRSVARGTEIQVAWPNRSSIGRDQNKIDMSPRVPPILKQASLLVFGLSVVVRMLIPTGYMPTAIGDGWPVTMCQHGMPHGMFSNPHHQHHADADETATLWDSCSFGAASAVYGPSGEMQIAITVVAEIAVPTAHVSLLSATTVVPFQPRAPPVINSRV